MVGVGAKWARTDLSPLDTLTLASWDQFNAQTQVKQRKIYWKQNGSNSVSLKFLAVKEIARGG